MSFNKGQLVRFTDKCKPSWWFGPHTPFKTGRIVSINIGGDDVEISPLRDGVEYLMPLYPFVDFDCIEPLEDDPPAANFIVLPAHLVKRQMTRNEAEELVQELTVPAFIVQIVSEHRAVH